MPHQFTKEELQELLFLIKNVPMDLEEVALVLKYVDLLTSAIEECNE